MKLEVTSAHPRAEEILRKALENYATVQITLATTTTNRPLHRGETEEDRQKRVATFVSREAAAWAMAQTIHDTTPPNY